jgi:hypothetical protein
MEPPTLLRTIMDPLIAFMDCYKPLWNPLFSTSLNLYSYYTLPQYPRPLFGPLTETPTLLRTTMDLSRLLTETPYLSANYYGPVKTPYENPYPPVNRYGPANRFYGPFPPTTYYTITVWQTSASKSAKVKRSGDKESTLCL